MIRGRAKPALNASTTLFATIYGRFTPPHAAAKFYSPLPFSLPESQTTPDATVSVEAQSTTTVGLSKFWKFWKS